MGGRNPYLGTRDVPPPTRPYRLVIVAADGREHTIDVDPAGVPYSGHGRPGSILDIALAHGVAIDHACGGVCACATCHVLVPTGGRSCNPPSDEEEDQLDEAPGLTPHSRLACQCVPSGAEDVRAEVPAWNRNAVREGHG